jgi:hypothetical protein
MFVVCIGMDKGREYAAWEDFEWIGHDPFLLL